MKEVKATTVAALACGEIFSKQVISTGNREKTVPVLQRNKIKSLLVLLLLVGTTFSVSAQKTIVLDALSKHGIDGSILDLQNFEQPDNYAFDLKVTSIAAGKQTVTLAKFDPSNAEEERWSVISVDGKSPSRGEINTFRKNHNKKQAAPVRADDASYKIDKESSDYLLISYKQDPATSPKDAGFMNDCRFYLTVNLKTKKAEQVQAINEKPVKIKILNAEKFVLTVKYNWNEQAKRYFTGKEDLDMLAKFLGQTTSIQTISEYANYTKK